MALWKNASMMANATLTFQGSSGQHMRTSGQGTRFLSFNCSLLSKDSASVHVDPGRVGFLECFVYWTHMGFPLIRTPKPKRWIMNHTICWALLILLFVPVLLRSSIVATFGFCFRPL